MPFDISPPNDTTCWAVRCRHIIYDISSTDLTLNLNLIAWQWRCGCLETDRLSTGDEIKISDRNSQWVVNIPRINRIFVVCTGVLKCRISEKHRKLKHPVISSNTRQYAWFRRAHYTDVIMTTMASQITSLTVVYSIVHSGADQRKHQSSASLAYVWGIHRDRWIPRTKGQ